jgi:hypothetical protein
MLERVLPLLSENQKNDVAQYAIEKLNESFGQIGYRFVKARKRKDADDNHERNDKNRHSVKIRGQWYASLTAAGRAYGITKNQINNHPERREIGSPAALEDLIAKQTAEELQGEEKVQRMTVGGSRFA